MRKEYELECEPALGQKRIKTNMQTGDGKIGLVEQAVIDKIAELGGAGRLIVIDKEGNFALPFNTAGMYRGHADSEGIAF